MGPAVTRWAALLRGINVGGSNRLAMADLRAVFEALGLINPTTYIQSGNVVFDAADDLDELALVERIAGSLVDQHRLRVPVVLRTAAEIGRIAAAHPDADSGLEPKLLHIMFLDLAPSSAVVDQLDPARHEPDGWTIDGREVYVRYPNGSARSKLTIDVFEKTLGVTATARNLNTVRKLAELADG
jgi:uncharacterized protein (DUF1697 family)